MSALPFGRTLEVVHGGGPASGIVHMGTAALVADVVAKKPGADKVLVDRFKGHVHRLLTRMLGPGPDVEDGLQEVLFRVFQRLHKVVPPDALPGYVTSVTVLVAREAIRKRKRARWLSFFSSDDLAALASHLRAHDVPEDVRSFYRVLAKLPSQSQLCVTLRHVEGMELQEMADAMGVSLATTKRYLQRAEQELGALLGREEPWAPGNALRGEAP